MDTMVGHSKGQITHTRIGRKPPRSAAASTPTIIAVVRIGDGADRGAGADLIEAFGETHAGELTGLNRTKQHRLVGASVGDR
jgi:hypothetical protein